ncbi:avr9 Cf-9 rapidly elicited protein [Musa troglodytarum]|nr:avr9 Cf-9 rapidly elicited protein [Musa troglodytarum]
MNLSSAMIDPRSQPQNAPASTLGAAALALHYANVIVLIEKLATSAHLMDADVRDDLYSMLTTSIKAALRARLKPYGKNLAPPAHNPALAAEWTAAVRGMLERLAPLAHNMIRWHSERSFEQQSSVPSSGILLLQTLYFADQRKAEDAITELLVGLNCLWRYRLIY